MSLLFNIAGNLFGVALAAMVAPPAADSPLPDIRQLMGEVQQHQRELDAVRETYTFTSTLTMQTLDGSGKVTKTETEEHEAFFVNGHVVERTVKKNGQPLGDHDQQKETERVTKQVEKAEKTPRGQSLEGPSITVGRLLEIMDVRNARRVNFRGRPTIVFDFVGRRDAKTHGLAEDASKKLQGTVWIDEADRQVAHLDVSFDDNFHVVGGLFANVQKGSNVHFDQAPVNPIADPVADKDQSPAPHAGAQGQPVHAEASNVLWLPTGGEATLQARLLLLKNLRQHLVERDYDYKRFTVAAEQAKTAHVSSAK